MAKKTSYKNMKILFYIIGLSALFFTSCSKDEDTIQPESEGKTTITFDAVFGSQDFGLNKDFTSETKTLNFTKFRYWVSNLVLVKSNGEEFSIPNSYYLLEETSPVKVQEGAFTYPATKREDIELKGIPAGEYKAIKFAVGVNSKYNDNLSLQAGELSQLNGMTNVSWMWMTSYIFTSIGGKMTESGTAKNLLLETGLNANYKVVSLDLPAPIQINSLKDSKIWLKADVQKAINDIDIIANPIVGASKATVMAAIATNYSTKVFSVVSAN